MWSAARHCYPAILWRLCAKCLIFYAARCENTFALRRALRTSRARFLIEVTASPLSFLSSSAERSAEPSPQRSPERTSERFAERFSARKTLTRRDRIVLRAVAEAMFSQDGEVERERLDAHLDEVDAFISNASKPVRLGLRFALFVVRLAPVLLLFRMRMLESLEVDERVAVLSRLERSRFAELSLAFIGWRTVMTLVFYEDPVELAALGYASDERKVYKRRLALAPMAAPMPMVAQAPPPEESGVRLRGDAGGADRDSDHPAPADAHDDEHDRGQARDQDEVA